MAILESTVAPGSDAYKANRTGMLALISRMRSLEERNWEEVADKMHRTTGAVRILWARALTQMRPLIEARL